MGKKQLTTSEWIDKARKTHGQLYDYSRVKYSKYGCKVVIGCVKHGWFEQTEYNHRNGAGCPKCGVEARAKDRAYDFNRFIVKANGVHKGVYEYPEQDIKNNRALVRIVCLRHGEFQQKVGPHLNGQGCKKCGYERNGKRSQLGLSDFLRRATEVHGETYEYLSGLNGLHKNMRIKCLLHGVFKQTPHNHLKGAGCPKCVSKVSKGEREIYDVVRRMCPDVQQSVRGLIGQKELDIYIPSKKVAIEFNGLWFHRESLVGNKHREKWESCAQQGIKLIQIFEDEWRDHKDIIINRLTAVLGASNSIYARKCTLVRPNAKQTRTFLEALHTQGAGNVLKFSYGLEYGGQVVAIATFCKTRFDNLADWELLRYASLGRVVGGISKLVTAFRREHGNPTVVSYADLRWGSGDAYASAGFTLQKITPPDYWWADCAKGIRYSRYSVQPSKTGMPEKEYAAKNKLYKVLGVGHKKWVLNM